MDVGKLRKKWRKQYDIMDDKKQREEKAKINEAVEKRQERKKRLAEWRKAIKEHRARMRSTRLNVDRLLKEDKMSNMRAKRRQLQDYYIRMLRLLAKNQDNVITKETLNERIDERIFEKETNIPGFHHPNLHMQDWLEFEDDEIRGFEKNMMNAELDKQAWWREKQSKILSDPRVWYFAKFWRKFPKEYMLWKNEGILPKDGKCPMINLYTTFEKYYGNQINLKAVCFNVRPYSNQRWAAFQAKNWEELNRLEEKLRKEGHYDVDILNYEEAVLRPEQISYANPRFSKKLQDDALLVRHMLTYSHMYMDPNGAHATGAHAAFDFVDWTKSPEQLAQEWGVYEEPPGYIDSDIEDWVYWKPIRPKKASVGPEVEPLEEWEKPKSREEIEQKLQAENKWLAEHKKYEVGQLSEGEEQEVIADFIKRKFEEEPDWPEDIELTESEKKEIMQERKEILGESHLHTMNDSLEEYMSLTKQERLDLLLYDHGIDTQGEDNMNEVKKMIMHKIAKDLGIHPKLFRDFLTSNGDDIDSLMALCFPQEEPISERKSEREDDVEESDEGNEGHEENVAESVDQDVYLSQCEKLTYNMTLLLHYIAADKSKRDEWLKQKLEEDAKVKNSVELFLLTDGPDSDDEFNHLADNLELQEKAARVLGISSKAFATRLNRQSGYQKFLDGTLFDGEKSLSKIAFRLKILLHGFQAHLNGEYSSEGLKQRVEEFNQLVSAESESSESKDTDLLEEQKILKAKQDEANRAFVERWFAKGDSDYEDCMLHPDEYDSMPVTTIEEELLQDEHLRMQQHLLRNPPDAILRLDDPYFRDVMPPDSEGEWDYGDYGVLSSDNDGCVYEPEKCDMDLPEHLRKAIDMDLAKLPKEEKTAKDLVREHLVKLDQAKKTLERIDDTWWDDEAPISLSKEEFVKIGLEDMIKHGEENGIEWTEYDLREYERCRERHWILYNLGLPFPDYDAEVAAAQNEIYENLEDRWLDHTAYVLKIEKRISEDDLKNLSYEDKKRLIVEHFIRRFELKPAKPRKPFLEDSDNEDLTFFFETDFYGAKGLNDSRAKLRKSFPEHF
jgi:hypothetical protein